MSAISVEMQSPAQTDLRAAQAEWNRLADLESELQRKKTWNGAPVEDEAAWVLAVADLEEAKRKAALAVREAAARKHEADVRGTNEQLGSAVPRYDEAANQVTQELRRFENLYCQLVVCGWALLEAAENERQLAGVLVRHAKAAAPSDEVRERITYDAPVEVPVALTLEGPSEYRERPSLALFGGASETADVRGQSFGENLGQLIRAGRRRAAVHVGQKVLDRLERSAEAHTQEAKR
jgi:hypothetical protein